MGFRSNEKKLSKESMNFFKPTNKFPYFGLNK